MSTQIDPLLLQIADRLEEKFRLSHVEPMVMPQNDPVAPRCCVPGFQGTFLILQKLLQCGRLH